MVICGGSDDEGAGDTGNDTTDDQYSNPPSAKLRRVSDGVEGVIVVEEHSSQMYAASQPSPVEGFDTVREAGNYAFN